MKLSLRLLFVAALISFTVFFGKKILALNDLAKFGVFLLVGATLGVIAVHWWLPRLADAVVRFLFSWNDTASTPEEDPTSLVTSMLAKGEYREAIVEYERQLTKTPMQPFVIGEMAKIYSDRLNEPTKAIELLDEQLAHHAWSIDDAAYLKFRQIEVILRNGDTELATQKLEQITKLYPESKHSGKALHWLHEMCQRQVTQMPPISIKQA